MINLLPEESKKELHAARQNNILLNYIILCALVLLAVIAIYALTFTVFKTTEKNSQLLSENNQSKVASMKKIEKEAKEYQNNLSIAKQIFSKNIYYSSVLMQIAKTTPQGVVIDNIPLSPEMAATQSQISIKAKDYQSVIKFRDSFSAASFTDYANIDSINDTSAAGRPDQQPNPYPLSAIINIKFNSKLLEAGKETNPKEAKS